LTDMTITRPRPEEFHAFYAGYVSSVPAEGPLALLRGQIAVFEALQQIDEAGGDFRYADGKWSVKEVLGHMSDAERVFSYRLTRIARADQTPLAGFDENAWAAVAPHGRRRLADVAGELMAVRQATIALVDSLDETAAANAGIANGTPVSARAICWIIPGHAQHHLQILRDRYKLPV
jgi:hypothetical protein